MNLSETFKPLVTLRASSQKTLTSSLFGNWFGGTVTKSGIPVNSNTAMTLSAVFNAVDIISTDYAKLPKHVFKKTEKGRDKVRNHPVQYLIGVAPNQFMTSFMFDKVMMVDALLRGNGFAEIIRDPYTNIPTALQFIDQDDTAVEVVTSSGKLYYKFNGRAVPAENIYHIPGFSYNGITGIGVVSFAARSLSVGLSSQKFADEYYGTKGVGVGILETDKTLNPAQKSAYSTGFNTSMSKAGEWKSAVLDEGMKYQNITISAQEAAFLSTNKFTIEEVARWFNIPPHKLKSLENSNNSISEQQEIMYVSDSVVPWAIRGEQEATRKLFTEAEIKANYYVKYNEAALLRADKKTQAEYFSKLVNSKIMSNGEARNKLDLPYMEGTDELLQPVNLVTESQFNAKLAIEKQSKTSKNE